MWIDVFTKAFDSLLEWQHPLDGYNIVYSEVENPVMCG